MQCNLLQYYLEINLDGHLHWVNMIWGTHISHCVIFLNLENKWFGELHLPRNLRLEHCAAARWAAPAFHLAINPILLTVKNKEIEKCLFKKGDRVCCGSCGQSLYIVAATVLGTPGMQEVQECDHEIVVPASTLLQQHTASPGLPHSFLPHHWFCQEEGKEDTTLSSESQRGDVWPNYGPVPIFLRSRGRQGVVTGPQTKARGGATTETLSKQLVSSTMENTSGHNTMGIYLWCPW